MNTLLFSIICRIDPVTLAFFFDDSEGDPTFLILLILVAGPVFFGVMYARYRNTKARHTHETETRSVLSNLRTFDNLVKRLKGQNSSRIRGANEKRVDGSLAAAAKQANKLNQ